MPVRYDLRGKVALITGGAQGIGLGLAQALARRGARLALVDLDGTLAAAEAARLGSEYAIGLAADVRSPEALAAAVEATIERFGAIDVVVANAGIAPRAATLRVMDPREFERVVEVDLLGVYRTVQATLPHVLDRRGHLVLTSSVYAFTNGLLVSPYAVAKAGVEQLGRALRVELRAHGAGVTVAYFGFVDTDMVRRGFDEDPLAKSLVEGLVPAFALRRITPAQAGEAVAVAIERRRPRVIAPRWWTALSVTRGLSGPLLDWVAERQPRLQQVLAEADVERSPDA